MKGCVDPDSARDTRDHLAKNEPRSSPDDRDMHSGRERECGQPQLQPAFHEQDSRTILGSETALGSSRMAGAAWYSRRHIRIADALPVGSQLPCFSERERRMMNLPFGSRWTLAMLYEYRLAGLSIRKKVSVR